MITTAKGLTSGYSPLGAVLCRESLAAPFLEGTASFTHGITFGGHPVSCAVALANLDLFERDGLVGNVHRNEAELRGRLESLLDLPIVGDVRGAGYFWALELVKGDGDERFTRAESEQLLRGFLGPRLFELGLVCRTDDRGDPVVQFAPTLIAGPEQFDEIESITRTALGEAWKVFRG